jgi:hypothetical protein
MNSTSKTLQILAQQLGEDNVSSRAELEAKLAPLLRLVLRTGQGHPSLLQCVRSALPVVAPAMPLGGQVDLEWAALKLARLLCSQLLRDVRAQQDTMVNRQTLAASRKPKERSSRCRPQVPVI